MGADLYAVGFNKHRDGLDSLWVEALRKRDACPRGSLAAQAAQAEVDRIYDLIHSEELYFRDSYNPTSVLWRLGLSWWADVSEHYTLKRPRVSKRNPHGVNMPPDLCLKLAAVVKAADLKPLTPEEYEKDFTPPPRGSSLDEWNAYYVEQRTKLVRFLKTAAAEGGVDASL